MIHSSAPHREKEWGERGWFNLTSNLHSYCLPPCVLACVTPLNAGVLVRLREADGPWQLWLVFITARHISRITGITPWQPQSQLKQIPSACGPGCSGCLIKGDGWRDLKALFLSFYLEIVKPQGLAVGEEGWKWLVTLVYVDVWGKRLKNTSWLKGL